MYTKKRIVSLFVAAVVLLSVFCPGVIAEPASDAIFAAGHSVSQTSMAASQKRYSGIDVSNHQGYIDWDTVSKQVDFAILRCGYGSDLTSQDDERWEQNASACDRLGIPYGAYLYSYALSDDQARSEADHALRLLNGHKPTLPVYLDLEDSVISGLSNDDLLRHTRIFCDALSAAGYKVGVYSSKSWWTDRLTSSEYDSWSRWVAVWGPDDPNYNKSYDIWQYSDNGSVSGITGRVDMDYWYGELPGMEYYVSFDPNGGNCSVLSRSVASGEAVGSLPAATRTGYKFDGWYTASNGGTKISSLSVFDSDTTIYAHWTADQEQVKLYGADGTVWKSVSVNAGDKYTLPAEYPTSDGKYFSGWAYTNGATVYDLLPEETITVNDAVELYPVYISHGIEHLPELEAPVFSELPPYDYF